jgi:hypothetical protein
VIANVSEEITAFMFRVEIDLCVMTPRNLADVAMKKAAIGMFTSM